METTKNTNKTNKRIDDIKAGYASGQLSHSQYNDLVADDEAAGRAETFRKAAGAGFLALIAFLLIWGSL